MMEESLEVLEQSFKNAMESAENIRKMYEQGMASEYDKIRSDVAARNISPTLTQARNGLELAKLQLKILLSLPLSQEIAVDGSFEQFSGQMLNYSAGILDVEQNSNLKTMDIQLERLNRALSLIVHSVCLCLPGFANYQMQMQNEEFNLNKPWANSFAVGLSLQIPIFN